MPRLAGIGANAGHYEQLGHQAVRVSWRLGDGSTLKLVANLSNEPLDEIDVWQSRLLWLEGFASGNSLDAWGVVWSIDEPSTAK